MNISQARQAILLLLQQQGRVRKSEVLALLEEDEDLMQKACDGLLKDGLVTAPDRKSLVLAESAGSPSGAISAEPGKVKVFISYGRTDAKELVDRLEKEIRYQPA